MGWIFYALLGAVAAGATAVLAKIGVAGIPSNLAVAIRTAVVLVFAGALVAARGEHVALPEMRGGVLVALVFSGAATAIP